MADLQFDTEQEFAPTSASAEPKGLTAIVMRYGLAKDEKSAQYVLLGTAVVAILIAVGLPFLFGGPTQTPLPSGTTIVNTPSSPPRLLTPLP